MTTPKQKILNIISENRGLATILSDIADYATPGALMKVLKDEKKEFEKFHGLVKMIKYIYPNIEDEKKWMEEYAKTLDVKKQTARYMLEYADINKLFVLKGKLIAKMINCGNASSKTWANLYEIDQNYVDGKVSVSETIDQLGAINTKISEIEVLKQIYKSYCYLDKKSFNLINDLIVDVEPKIEQIKDDYIRDLIYGRYMTLKLTVNERNGNPELTRVYAQKILSEVENEYILSMAYLYMGNSFIVEDFDKSYRYLRKGILLSEGFNPRAYEYLKSSMSFLHNVWKKDPPNLDFESKQVGSIHEVVFYYINKSKHNEALMLLQNINMDSITTNEKAFNYYLRGLISKDIDDFCKSVKYFKESGDLHFRQLPLLELEKMGVQPQVVDLLLAM